MVSMSEGIVGPVFIERTDRDVVCPEVAGLGGLHELQDVQQELQVLWIVLVMI